MVASALPTALGVVLAAIAILGVLAVCTFGRRAKAAEPAPNARVTAEPVLLSLVVDAPTPYSGRSKAKDNSFSNSAYLGAEHSSSEPPSAPHNAYHLPSIQPVTENGQALSVNTVRSECSFGGHPERSTPGTSTSRRQGSNRASAVMSSGAADSFMLFSSHGVMLTMQQGASSEKPKPTLEGLPPLSLGNPLGLELQDLLGKGGGGIVYRGVWKGQVVAVKVIQRRLKISDVSVIEEGDTLLASQLQHEHILNTHAYAIVKSDVELSDDEDNDAEQMQLVEVHVVSEFCDRGTFRDWLNEQKQILYPRPPPPSGELVGCSGSQVVTIQGQIISAAHSYASSLNRAQSQQLRDSEVLTEMNCDSAETHKSSAQERLQLQEQHLYAMQQLHQHNLPAHPPLPFSLHDPLKLPSGSSGSRKRAPIVPPPVLLPEDVSLQLSAEGGDTPGSDMPAPEVLLNKRASHRGLLIAQELLRAQASLCGVQLEPSADSGPIVPVEMFRSHLKVVLECLLEMASGLAYLHDQGIVHGDIKSHNMLRCTSEANLKDFICKVADFGFSRFLAQGQTHTYLSNPRGTLVYLAPELLAEMKLSKTTDIYSFGLLVWEGLTCHFPFKGLTPAQLIWQKSNGYDFVKLVWPYWCPRTLVDLVRRCCATDPADRPLVMEVQRVLTEVYEGELRGHS